MASMKHSSGKHSGCRPEMTPRYVLASSYWALRCTGTFGFFTRTPKTAPSPPNLINTRTSLITALSAPEHYESTIGPDAENNPTVSFRSCPGILSG